MTKTSRYLRSSSTIPAPAPALPRSCIGLRELVYGYLPNTSGESNNANKENIQILTALMGTCHQLYSEAAPLRYKNTSITHFDGYRDISIPEVSPFFPIIGSLIKNLEIRVHSEPRELGYSPSIGHHSANILRHSNALSTYCPQLLNLTYLVCISQKSKSGTACKWAEISLSAEQKQDERQVWELYEALSRAGLLSAELVEAAEEVRRAKAFHQEGGILTLNMTFGDGTESIPNALPPFFSIKLVGQDREKDGFERENMFIASLLKQLRESTGL